MKAKNTKVKSKKQESKVAKDIGGSVVVASGALWSAKSDVKSDTFLIECKTTEKPFYSLSIKTWLKAEKEALIERMRIPLMHIQLQDGKEELAIMNFLDFRGLDLDMFDFIGNPEPIMIDAKSHRITADFIAEALIDSTSDLCYYYRQDLKFINEHRHLVILKWTDLLQMMELN